MEVSEGTLYRVAFSNFWPGLALPEIVNGKVREFCGWSGNFGKDLKSQGKSWN